jgi:hypothetical protein
MPAQMVLWAWTEGGLQLLEECRTEIEAAGTSTPTAQALRERGEHNHADGDRLSPWPGNGGRPAEPSAPAHTGGPYLIRSALPLVIPPWQADAGS